MVIIVGGTFHSATGDAFIPILSPDYLGKSTYYTKRAIINGHNTGYAHDRLAKNLDKAKL